MEKTKESFREKAVEKSPRKVDPNKRANELQGKQWLQNSISVWSDISKDGEERGLGHPAMFPWKLAARVIETFCKPTMTSVIDPFIGSGSTLVACQHLGKQGTGIDISREYLNLAERRLSEIAKPKKHKHRLIHDSSESALTKLSSSSFDMCFTSPPYWDILSQRRTADGKGIKDYARKNENLSNIDDYDVYLLKMQSIFKEVHRVLRPGSYCVVNVMDIRKKSTFYPLHQDLSDALVEIGFNLDDIIIWDRRKDYNFLRPLGYPYVFRVNKVHEFLLIFQKTIKTGE